MRASRVERARVYRFWPDGTRDTTARKSENVKISSISDRAAAARSRTGRGAMESIAAMRAHLSTYLLCKSEQWFARYSRLKIRTCRVSEIPARTTRAGSKKTWNNAPCLIDACLAHPTSSGLQVLARWISRNGRFRHLKKVEKHVFRSWLPRRRTRPGLQECDR